MPLIKVHISSLEAPANKSLLTKRLRKVMSETLKIDEKIGQVVLYEAKPQYRAIHSERSNNFVFLEVLMYSGRTSALKETLMRNLVEEVHKIIKVDMNDINCCLQEISQDNWYGGISHKNID